VLLKIFFAEKFGNKLVDFLLKILLVLPKKLILIFFKKTPIFSQKMAKIVENTDHSIGPRLSPRHISKSIY
jgi:hypothetical protein